MVKWSLVYCALVSLVQLGDSIPSSVKHESDLEPVPLVATQDVDQSYFLPKNTVPSRYVIHLRTDIHNNVRTFDATTQVFFTVLEPTTTVTMHVQELTIGTVALYRVPSTGGDPVLIYNPTFTIDMRIEHITFVAPAELPTGSYMMEVTYTGTMRNYQSGYLVSQYRDESNNWVYVGSTHFQATLARRVFPCYDEPALKATFSLTVTHHRTYTAVANTPRTSITIDPADRNYLVSQFQETPKMSTYLLAFAVGNFATRTEGKHEVVARANAFRDTVYASEAGAKILDQLSAYVDIDYYEHMPKMTSIAIPDRGTGAMENWGLVTYGEPSLLFDAAVNSYRNRKGVTTIIAHEYAHQWFGDLVSPEWWEFIWLNEGFATLYQYYAAKLAYPGDEYWELFNLEVIHQSFVTDAAETIRPMNWNAASQDDVHQLFDDIAYKKAGSVLNMFRYVTGETVWQEALKEYLLRRAYAGATDLHLYAALQSTVAGRGIIPDTVTMEELMGSWANAPGYPVLHVQRLYHDGQMIISQERFLNNLYLPDDYTWYIPYNYASESSATFYDVGHFDWLSLKAAKITTGTPDNEWIVFNKQQTGYYRVNYDLRNWNMIIDALNSNHLQIHRANRAQLIDDAFNLARADLLDFGVVLRLLTYLRAERDYAPWAVADKVLKYFEDKLRGTAHYPAFHNFIDSILEEVYATVSVDTVNDGESVMYKYLRQLVTTWGCRIGYQDCLSRSRAALSAERNGELTVHPDVRAVVYCFGLQEDTAPEFQAIYQRLINSRNQAERTDLIDALGCSKNANDIKTLMATIPLSALPDTNFVYLSEERGRIMQAIYSGGRHSIDAMIEALSDVANAQTLLSVVGEGTFRNAIINIAMRTNNEQEMQQLETLLTTLGTTISQDIVRDARETAVARDQWFVSLEGLVVDQFLDGY